MKFWLFAFFIGFHLMCVDNPTCVERIQAKKNFSEFIIFEEDAWVSKPKYSFSGRNKDGKSVKERSINWFYADVFTHCEKGDTLIKESGTVDYYIHKKDTVIKVSFKCINDP